MVSLRADAEAEFKAVRAWSRSPFLSFPAVSASATDADALPVPAWAPALMEEAPDSASELSASRGIRDMALAGVVFCANSGNFASMKFTTRRR